MKKLNARLWIHSVLCICLLLFSIIGNAQVPEQLEGKWRGMIEVNDGTKKLYGEIRLVIGGFLNTSTPNNIDFEIKNFAVERNSYFKYVKDVYYGSDNKGNRTVVFPQIALLDASRAKINGKYTFRHNVGSNGTVSLIGHFTPDDAANKHLSINAWLVKKDKYENYTEEEMKIALALIAPDKPSQQSQGAKTNSKSSTSDDNYEFNKNKSFIAKAFQDYKQYASAGKGADAILFIDKQSISHFQQVADWVRTADSSTVAKLPFMDALLVLMTRTVATKEQIASFNGEQLLIFAINNSFIGKDNGSTGSMAENTLEINATEATVASMINGQVTGVDYVFHKEDWQWKFNVEAVIEISNRVLSQLAANSGRTYDPKFKTELTTLMTNKTVPKNVWRPVGNINADAQNNTSNTFIKSKIDIKLITLPTDKKFKWIAWKTVPNEIKQAAKLVNAWGGTLYERLQKEQNDYECDIEIALIDLNNNGIYGFAKKAYGSGCCGTRGCMVGFYEDGGLLYSELSYDYSDEDIFTSPANNAVRSSTKKLFPFINNSDIKSSEVATIKNKFRYK